MNSTSITSSQRNLSRILAVLFCLFSVTVIHAQTYSVSSDYTTASNPNGVWTYGWTATLGGSLNLYSVITTATDGGSTSAWLDPNNDGGASDVPSVGNNSSGQSFVDGSYTLPSGWAYFAPGLGNGDFSDIRFTAPTGGIYNIDLLFQGGQTADPYETDSDVYVLTPGGTAFSYNIVGTGEKGYEGDVSLNAGQTINIAVGVDASQLSGLSDNTNLQGTISLASVPEPSTWATLIVGAGTLVLFRRRR
jgi:hypothetical protein